MTTVHHTTGSGSLPHNDSQAADVESKALLTELQKLVEQAGELASA